jgi:Flp pilus assembly protein TadG
MGHQQSAKSPATGRGLRSLLRDSTANTIMLAAAALVPLMATVGGGVDASRYYMTASRLQAACDAGALAARRAMVTDQYTTEHNQIALNFFDFNFSNNLYGTTNRTRSFTSNGKGLVTGNASVVLPTVIMSAFGYNTFNIAVTCSADINISNTDIMFVLDTTGSMGSTNSGDSVNRIQGLRNAVMGFYDTVKASTSGSAQVRFGAVAYSTNVNVGHLLPSQYIADSHTYQSRVANFRTETRVIQEWNGISVGDTIFISEGPEWIPKNTANFGSGVESHLYFKNRAGRPDRNDNDDRDLCEDDLNGTYTVNGQTWRVRNADYIRNQWPDAPIDTRAGCRATVRKTRLATQDDVIPEITEDYQVFDNYTYRPVTYNVSGLKNGGSISLPTGVAGAMETHTWNGCIEEAQTLNQASFDPRPADAFDININLIPTTEAQRWKPTLPNALWERRNSSGDRQLSNRTTSDANLDRPSALCPLPAFRLTNITRDNLQAFVNGLVAQGNTYHNIGMVWGARLISPSGMFAADNNSAPNGDPIARHIVFMTDGALEPNNNIYSSYGMEWWDRRVTTDGNSNHVSRHDARLQAICRAAKEENISVWVVAFGTTLTSNLVTCASPGRAYQASNNDQLNAAFQEIAQKIAALRLTQ